MATARSVLVVTPSRSFGEFIQKTLEETGLYKVMLVDSNQEALLCIQTVSFTLAILDSELSEAGMVTLATSMRERLPKMRLVFICAPDDLQSALLADLQPSGLLRKPFDKPQLLVTIADAVQTPVKSVRPAPIRSQSSPSKRVMPTTPPAPAWLQDADWVAQHLTRLSLESAAQAALIVRDDSLWAYAGGFSQTAAHELAEYLTHYWDLTPNKPVNQAFSRNGDMVRFVRLESTDGEYMLYATALGQGMVLSLIFDSDTPFSTIRHQANYLARALATPPGTPLPPYPTFRDGMQPVQHGPVPDEIMPKTTLPPLLEDVPPPSPFRTAGKSLASEPEATWPVSMPKVDLLPSQPIVPPNPNRQPAHPTRNPATPAATRNEENGKTAMASDLLPPTPTLHYLIYNCTLLPRLPQHHLSGDIAQRLQLWMPQLFLAFGWQLIKVSVHPQFMQIAARIAPNTSPGSLIRTIRQQTSQRIFSTFPLLAQDNPSGDFWAPGYLILTSSQSPPDHIIQNFIEQTRQQQGVRPAAK